ncbi:pentatricopeptide repeat-containing protein At5g04780, mitochondrial [Euphorbia lathyris]|uniref:pentatricopeptide repeat-containing protein At5g04780, mitochondrial n=1 Tax=Euphorbia lathyris TaxID=212925 RepID=UPI00331420E4
MNNLKGLSRHRYRVIQTRYISITTSTCTSNSKLVLTLQNGNGRHTGTKLLPFLHSLIQLCAKGRQPIKGKACHAQVITLFGLKSDTLTSNMLINMYAKTELLDSARKLFDQMPDRTLVSWNTMITAYAKNGEEQKALLLFLEMQREGNPFTEFTLTSVVCASSAKKDSYVCKQLHASAVKALVDTNSFVGTALLDFYAKTGLIQDAIRIFESIPERSDVTWSSMVAGYVKNELFEEALALVFSSEAQPLGLLCNHFIISSVISACAGLATLIEGKQLHSIVCKSGFASNNYVASSLADMYAKCGSVKEAYATFVDAEGTNLVLWNVMISAFAKHSHSLEVMILFEKMQQVGLRPDEVTYVAILSACSHSGLVDTGRSYFNLMRTQHNILPNVVHYSCMVDILYRAGLTNEAHELMKNMPFPATASMWGSVLASCRNHRSLELAETAAKILFEMEPDNAGNYVLLSNAYAASEKWKEVAKTRKLMKENEVRKEKGKSWIEIKNTVHTFMAGEQMHPRTADIYVELDKLLEEMEKLGYKCETEYELHYVDEDRKRELLRQHSEKLALVFGLMCLPPTVPIRIMKNLQICGDCHSFMKLASSITRREIIVRDVNRFHHFRNGCCSCRDFW